jgi:hypothetical protein
MSSDRVGRDTPPGWDSSRRESDGYPNSDRRSDGHSDSGGHGDSNLRGDVERDSGGHGDSNLRGNNQASNKREANRVEADRARSFATRSERPRLLLIGEDAGIAPMLALAEHVRGNLASSGGQWKPLVLLGSVATPFPFRARPSSVIVAGIPVGVIACMPLLEEWGISSRLASNSDLPGCFDGSVTALADAWLASLGPSELAEVEIFACGPAPMLDASRELATRYGIACQTALHEFLARSAPT